MGEFGDKNRNNADILVFNRVFEIAKKGGITKIDGVNVSGYSNGQKLTIGFQNEQANEQLRVTVVNVNAARGYIEVTKTNE